MPVWRAFRPGREIRFTLPFRQTITIRRNRAACRQPSAPQCFAAKRKQPPTGAVRKAESRMNFEDAGKPERWAQRLEDLNPG